MKNEQNNEQRSVGTLAKKAHVGRKSLYKILSRTGNPK